MERNPDSHQGTEWLHIKILEAKLALAQDPNWLKTHSVLGLNFGKQLRPHFPPELDSQSARERVRKALRYQLSERIPLVSPPDAVVGDLLFDLANLAALMQSAHRGQEMMQESLRYGPPRRSLAQKRRDYFASFDKKKDAPQPPSPPQAPSPAPYRWRAVLAVLGLLGVQIWWGRPRR